MYHILYSYNKGNQRIEYVIEKIIRKGKYIYSTVLYLLKTKSVYKWAHAVQTRVVHRPAVLCLIVRRLRGTWVAQWVKCLGLGFGSGYDLPLHGFEPHVRLCDDNVEPVWASLSPSLSAPPLLVCALCLSPSKNR